MRSTTIFLAVLISIATAGLTHAGPYTDDLSKCLVEKTTVEDRNSLVRWMFIAASRHPAVSSISAATESDIDRSNQKTAELFMRLLTDSCKDTTRTAFKYEGLATIETSFAVLGEVAATELFASQEVAVAISGLEKYVDVEKLTEIIEGK